MSQIKVNQSLVNKEIADQLIKLCPFNAFEYDGVELKINAGCKVCKICVNKGPKNVCKFLEEKVKAINKDEWKGISVYIEHSEGIAHNVSWELIGKAKELANDINQEVHAILIGHNVEHIAHKALKYGVDKVFLYDDEAFKLFNVETYTNAFEDYIKNNKPNTVLIGGTYLGRSFAPRVAARFKTGLTADCTSLKMKESTDLLQIRPAFGGNIMASIVTTNHRPQLATIRYKMFKSPEKVTPFGEIIKPDTDKLNKSTTIKTLEILKFEKTLDISEAEVIVAVGRAFKRAEDLKMAYELAELLGGELACTRPVIENGWMDARKQIGLSGRTVSPKLLINLGISGAVQFIEGMKGSETIITIDNNPSCELFNVSHHGIVGDIYKVVPKLIDKIKSGKSLV